MKIPFQQLSKLPTLILLSALTGITTILVCYLIATVYGHYPTEKVWLPFISLTGYKAPEYYLYVLGFCTTGILFIYCGYCIHYHILPQTEIFTKTQLHRLFIILTSGVCFFMLHAIIPLQDDIVTTKSLTWGSTIHQSSAGIFFLLVIVHTIYFFTIVKNKPYIYNYLDRRGMKIRMYCLVGSCLTVVLAMVVHPTTKSMFGDKANAMLPSLGALAQWILVGSIIIIFSSYAMDIQKILPFIYEKEQKMKKNHN